MEAKIADLERSKNLSLMKISLTKDELDHRIDDIQKSVGESFKSFLESNHVLENMFLIETISGKE